jgi:hypothetical protein
MDETQLRKIKLTIIALIALIIIAVGAYAAWNFIIKINNDDE